MVNGELYVSKYETEKHCWYPCMFNYMIKMWTIRAPYAKGNSWSLFIKVYMYIAHMDYGVLIFMIIRRGYFWKVTL